jgi:hypothetical protein
MTSTAPAALISQRIGVIVVAVVICTVIFELIRRKHLMERYAILWLCLGITTFVLAAWKGLLTTFSEAVGIYYPPAALFAVAFLFVMALLLNFSIVISRLSNQNKILAQRLALLQQRLDEKGSADNEPTEPTPPEPSEAP